METIRKHIKLISLLMSFLFLAQSCSVYHTKTVTVDEAIQSNKRVKANSSDFETYKFEKLQKEENQIYGIAKRKSSTAEMLSDQIVNENENNKSVKILLTDNNLKEIHLQNKTMSTILPIAIPLLIIGILAITIRDSISLDLGGSFNIP